MDLNQLVVVDDDDDDDYVRISRKTERSGRSWGGVVIMTRFISCTGRERIPVSVHSCR